MNDLIKKTDCDAVSDSNESNASKLRRKIERRCVTREYVIQKMHLSASTLLRLEKRDELVRCSLNQKVYYRRRELEELFARSYVQSKIDIGNNLTKVEVHKTSLEEWKDTEDVLTDLQVSAYTLKRYRHKGYIAYTRVGSKYFYRDKDVERVLLKNVRMWEEE